MTDSAKADLTAQAASQAIQALRESARTHKQLADRHRRSARRIMEERERFINQCYAAGIAIVIETEAN